MPDIYGDAPQILDTLYQAVNAKYNPGSNHDNHTPPKDKKKKQKRRSQAQARRKRK